MNTFNINYTLACLLKFVLSIHKLFICLGWSSWGSSGKHTYTTITSNLSQLNTVRSVKCALFIQVEAAPAQLADVPPPAPIAVEDASEEESEVSRHIYIYFLIYYSVFEGRYLFQNVFQFTSLYNNIFLTTALDTNGTSTATPAEGEKLKRKLTVHYNLLCINNTKNLHWIYRVEKTMDGHCKNSIQAAKEHW